MKKLIITLTLIQLSTVANATPNETMYEVDQHKACWCEPVFVKEEVAYNQFNEPYNYNIFINKFGERIDTSKETIYIDENNNRWFFPYDGLKFHEHYTTNNLPSAIIREQTKDGE